MKGRGAQAATRQQAENAAEISICAIKERADGQTLARNASKHLDDSVLGRPKGGLPVTQDKAGSLVSGFAPEFVLGQNEKRPTLLVKRLRGSVEGLGVFSDALARLDLD